MTLDQGTVPHAAPLAELRAWLRAPVGDGSRADDKDADAIVAALHAASEQVEALLGRALVARSAIETRGVTGGWQRLATQPVRAITAVERVAADGTRAALPVTSYAIEIDDAGAGWVRIADTSVAGRVAVTLVAGMAERAEDLPAAIRQAVVLQAATLLDARDGAEARRAIDPAAAGLLAPWRRARL